MAQVLATKEWAKEGRLSIWEAECHLDAELFLDEYLQWEVGGTHHLFILQRIFVHANEAGQKENEEGYPPRPSTWPAKA